MNVKKIIQLTEYEIQDLFHAIDINLKTLKLTYDNQKNQESQLYQIFKINNTIKKKLSERKNQFSNFLIHKLIENQEQQVRRERLFQYQHQLCEKSRILSDKQTQLESLLRPKQILIKNSHSLQRKSKNSAQKYRLLLEQIENCKEFINTIKQNQQKSKKKIQIINEKKQSNLNQIVKYKTKSLNNSIVIESARISYHNVKFEENCPESEKILGNINAFSQRSRKNIQFVKQERFKNIQKEYEESKKWNSFPLPFNRGETKSNYEYQQYIIEQKLRKIKQRIDRIFCKKQINHNKQYKIFIMRKQIDCYQQIISTLKQRYKKYVN